MRDQSEMREMRERERERGEKIFSRNLTKVSEPKKNCWRGLRASLKFD